MEPMVEGFMKAYPNVQAELVNVGTGTDHYTAVENAIQAGSGIPDVIVMEYQAVSQFALDGTLADLSGYGADKHAKSFTTGTWDAVQFDGGIYSMPMSSGPMALFYNKEVFDKHDLEVPETWEQFLETGHALKEADPKAYIANETGSANLLQGLLWQQGYTPYTVEGEKVRIALDGPEVEKYAGPDGSSLLARTSSWPRIEDWSASGTRASPTAASPPWSPAPGCREALRVRGRRRQGRLARGADAAVGVRGEELRGERRSRFGPRGRLEEQGPRLRLPRAGRGRRRVASRLNATFPSTVADLQSEEFLGLESDYFGGQRINEVFAESAASVPEGWSFLPTRHKVYAELDSARQHRWRVRGG